MSQLFKVKLKLVGAGVVTLALVLFACSPAEPVHNQRLYIFGTLVDIQVQGVEKSLADEAFSKLDHEFLRMHIEWHAWKPDGELYRINKNLAAGRKQQPVSDFVAALISRSQELHTASDGLFNPAMGNLIGLWGFHQDDRPSGPPPGKQAITRLLKLSPGMDDVDIRQGQLHSRNSAVSLDFGGFAKGYAMDWARNQLKSMGIHNAILNAGGDLCIAGVRDGRPWRVGVRHPQDSGILASLGAADGECVMTSGNYMRFLEHEGVRYAHILDPRTGYPVQGIVSVTVIDRDGGLADAAATALTVAGVKDWHRIAKQLGLKYVMLVADDGTVYVNPAMARRIEYEGTKPEHIVVSSPL